MASRSSGFVTFGCGNASTLGVDGTGTLRNSASDGIRYFFRARSMSCSVTIGWDRLARSMSASVTVADDCANAPRINSRNSTAMGPVARPKVRVISVADTAVPFPEEHESEVFATDRIFLARTPQHGRAAEGLAAFAVGLVGVGNGIGQLGLVGGLVHYRQEVRAAQAGLAVPAPGDQFAVHLGG